MARKRPPPDPVPSESPEPEVTRLLTAMSKGRADAAAELMPLVYAELRALAAAMVHRSGSAGSIAPTTLVHEAYLKLVGQGAGWKNRAHFFNVAAMAMRQLLANHARKQGAKKRGGGGDWTRVTLSGIRVPRERTDFDLSDLDRALSKLGDLSERQARVVELRFLAGLSVAEAAEALGVSERTIELDWRFARAWLKRELESPVEE